MGSLDPADYVPEDVLREVLEEEGRLKPRSSSGRRRRYPHVSDLREAIVEAVRLFYGHPDEFPEFVLEVLESRGFDTKYVTVKRIWRVYEELVRRRFISDYLGVLEGGE